MKQGEKVRREHLTVPPYFRSMDKSLTQMSVREREKHTVKLANKVINGSRSLSLVNEMFLYFIMSQIDPKSKNPLRVVCKKKDYALFRGMTRSDHKYIARELKKIFKNFKDNSLIVEDVVEIELKNGKKKLVDRLLQRVWLTGLDLIGDDIVIGLSEEVGGFLMYRKGQPYTKVLSDISRFTKSYTVGIKELIEAHLYKKVPYFDKPIKELAFKLGVHKRYPNLYDFKKYVLNPAERDLKQINYPLQFDYQILDADNNILKPGKRGGVAVRFYIIDRRNEVRQLLEAAEASPITEKGNEVSKPDLSEQLQTQLADWGINKAKQNQLLKERGEDRIRQAIDFVSSTPNVKNPAGLFLKAVAGEWKNAEQAEREKKRRIAARYRKQAEAEAQEKQRSEERYKAFHQEMTRIAESLLTEEKNLAYYQREANKYHHRMMLKYHADYTPEQAFERDITRSQMLFAMMVEHPEAFIQVNEQYPDLKLSYTVHE